MKEHAELGVFLPVTLNQHPVTQHADSIHYCDSETNMSPSKIMLLLLNEVCLSEK